MYFILCSISYIHPFSLFHTSGALVEQRTSEVSELCSGLSQMVDNLKGHIKKLEEEETAHMANSREWAEDLKKHCLQNKVGTQPVENIMMKKSV